LQYVAGSEQQAGNQVESRKWKEKDKNRWQISDVRCQEKQGQRNSKNRKQKSFQMYLVFMFFAFAEN